jgi:hypothetical protein
MAQRQRAAGAFATAALVLIVTVPLGIQTIEQGRPTHSTVEVSSSEQPSLEVADAASTKKSAGAIAVDDFQSKRSEPRINTKDEGPAATRNPRASRSSGPAVAGSHADSAEQASALVSAPAASTAASDMAVSGVQLAENERAEEVVVTGSRIRQPEGLNSARSAMQSSPLAAVDKKESFLSELRAALSSGNRGRVLQLTGLPLQVHYARGAVTYRKAIDVERNFERIFTQAVVASLMDGKDDRARLRADGTLVIGRVTISTFCERSRCLSSAPLRIIAVTPK